MGVPVGTHADPNFDPTATRLLASGLLPSWVQSVVRSQISGGVVTT